MERAQARPLRVTLLFAAVILAWGITWPAAKIGIQYMPPAWFAGLRCLLGAAAMFIVVAALKQLRLPKREDIPLLLSMGILQIGTFLLLVTIGLYYINANRAVILAYTTPLWVLPVTVIFFGERLNRYKFIGFIFGALGIVLLFCPWEFDWHSTKNLIGNGLLILAAFSWAAAMIHARYATWHSSPLQLAPWELLIAAVEILIIAMIWQPHPTIIWNVTLWAALSYTAILATAFGFWGSITLSKELPTITTSIGMLGVPLFGILSSFAFLNEDITWTMFIALCAIIVGLVFIALSARR